MNISKEASENVNPKKFSLWLFLIAIIMLFAGFTSAYIVRIKEGNWLEFELPEIFLYSSITILISSLTMIWAYRAAKNDEIKSVTIERVGEAAMSWNAVEAFRSFEGSREEHLREERQAQEKKLDKLATGFEKTKSGLRYQFIQRGEGRTAETVSYTHLTLPTKA